MMLLFLVQRDVSACIGRVDLNDKNWLYISHQLRVSACIGRVDLNIVQIEQGLADLRLCLYWQSGFKYPSNERGHKIYESLPVLAEWI